MRTYPEFRHSRRLTALIFGLLLLPWSICTQEIENNQTEVGNHDQIGDELELDYPIVNKCCPFNWSYEDGKCVKSDVGGGNDSSIETETETPVLDAPKTIVTLAKDFHTFNMTEGLGDPVVFR